MRKRHSRVSEGSVGPSGKGGVRGTTERVAECVPLRSDLRLFGVNICSHFLVVAPFRGNRRGKGKH